MKEQNRLNPLRFMQETVPYHPTRPGSVGSMRKAVASFIVIEMTEGFVASLPNTFMLPYPYEPRGLLVDFPSGQVIETHILSGEDNEPLSFDPEGFRLRAVFHGPPDREAIIHHLRVRLEAMIRESEQPHP